MEWQKNIRAAKNFKRLFIGREDADFFNSKAMKIEAKFNH